MLSSMQNNRQRESQIKREYDNAARRSEQKKKTEKKMQQQPNNSPVVIPAELQLGLGSLTEQDLFLSRAGPRAELDLRSSVRLGIVFLRFFFPRLPPRNNKVNIHCKLRIYFILSYSVANIRHVNNVITTY